MDRSVPLGFGAMFFVGAVIGAAIGVVAVSRLNSSSEQHKNLTPELLSCQASLKQLGSELSELKSKPASPCVATSRVEQMTEQKTPHESKRDSDKRLANSWRISAIEKFVPLSEDQKERLERKFTEEQAAKDDVRESVAESLDDILGVDNAKVYRDQMEAAFERAREEELERDTIWMARKLGLVADQEERLRATFAEVDQIIRAEFNASPNEANSSAQQRVARMIAENKRRIQLRAERVRSLLSPGQYQEYVKLESESSAADVEVFHSDQPGE
jgi:hypothetical protein